MRVREVARTLVGGATPSSGEAFFYPGAVHHRATGGVPMALTSLIVVNWDGLHHLAPCIDSIRRHTEPPFELIVVDNGSTDGSVKWLHETEDDNTIFNPENMGWTHAINQGLRRSRGDFVVLMNNDVLVTHGWSTSLTRPLKGNPGLSGPMSGGVSGKQYLPTTMSTGLREQMDHFSELNAESHRGEYFSYPRLVGFCLMASREVIDEIGGLDERFASGGFDDDDFCVRAALAGFPAYVVRDAYVHHEFGATFRAHGIDYGPEMMRNWVIFKQKWGLDPALDLADGARYGKLLSQRYNRKKHHVPLS